MRRDIYQGRPREGPTQRPVRLDLEPSTKAMNRSLHISELGVVVRDACGPLALFFWDEVEQIATFKADLGVYDEICLRFETRDDETVIGEEAEGWPALIETMTRLFGTIPEDWFEMVMLPPFAASARILYRRDDPTSTANGPCR